LIKNPELSPLRPSRAGKVPDSFLIGDLPCELNKALFNVKPGCVYGCVGFSVHRFSPNQDTFEVLHGLSVVPHGAPVSLGDDPRHVFGW
jgi:hypothetical protein